MSENEYTEGDRVNSAERLPAEAVADLLESDRRQRLITVLANAEEPLEVTDLARRIASLDEGERADAAPADEVDTLRREIFSEHLPKLTATEVVAYDSLVGTVELATEDERLLDPAETEP